MNTKNLVVMSMILHDVDDDSEQYKIWSGFYWLVVQREWIDALVEVLESVADTIDNNGDYDECMEALDSYPKKIKEAQIKSDD